MINHRRQPNHTIFSSIQWNGIDWRPNKNADCGAQAQQYKLHILKLLRFLQQWAVCSVAQTGASTHFSGTDPAVGIPLYNPHNSDSEKILSAIKFFIFKMYIDLKEQKITHGRYSASMTIPPMTTLPTTKGILKYKIWRVS